MHRESSSGILPKTEIDYPIPGLNGKFGQHFFPYFMWCFYIKVDLKMDGFQIFSDSWPQSDRTDLVGSGELSTEKLWSQVSEANCGAG